MIKRRSDMQAMENEAKVNPDQSTSHEREFRSYLNKTTVLLFCLGFLLDALVIHAFVFNNPSELQRRLMTSAVAIVGLTMAALRIASHVVDSVLNSTNRTTAVDDTTHSAASDSTAPGMTFAPPKLAILLVDVLLNKKEKQDGFGHIEEEFDERVKKHGMRAGQTWVWIQVIRSIGPFVLRLLALWKISQFIK